MKFSDKSYYFRAGITIAGVLAGLCFYIFSLMQYKSGCNQLERIKKMEKQPIPFTPEAEIAKEKTFDLEEISLGKKPDLADEPVWTWPDQEKLTELAYRHFTGIQEPEAALHTSIFMPSAKVLEQMELIDRIYGKYLSSAFLDEQAFYEKKTGKAGAVEFMTVLEKLQFIENLRIKFKENGVPDIPADCMIFKFLQKELSGGEQKLSMLLRKKAGLPAAPYQYTAADRKSILEAIIKANPHIMNIIAGQSLLEAMRGIQTPGEPKKGNSWNFWKKEFTSADQVRIIETLGTQPEQPELRFRDWKKMPPALRCAAAWRLFYSMDRNFLEELEKTAELKGNAADYYLKQIRKDRKLNRSTVELLKRVSGFRKSVYLCQYKKALQSSEEWWTAHTGGPMPEQLRQVIWQPLMKERQMLREEFPSVLQFDPDPQRSLTKQWEIMEIRLLRQEGRNWSLRENHRYQMLKTLYLMNRGIPEDQIYTDLDHKTRDELMNLKGIKDE